jgi:LmbE family N-acetylglucosaminyl deacetylase
MTSRPPTSPLLEPETLPLAPPDIVTELGPTVIIAPHPDDETLGCGGLIALLSARDIPVHVVVVSDGTGSHRMSKTFPPDRLRRLRQRESVAAVAELARGRGRAHARVDFVDLPDERVPGPQAPGFEEAVRRCAAAIGMSAETPATVVVTWRQDPHRDHRASWQIVRGALQYLRLQPRVLEYPVWVTEFGGPADLPMPGEMRAWRLDIGAVLDTKMAAIAKHRSQTTDLIDDDPSGFRLSDETLQRFTCPWEIYMEPVHD